MLRAKHLRHPLRTMFLAYCYYSSVIYDLAHGIRTSDTEPLSTLELTRPEHLAYGSSCLPSQPQDIRSVFHNLGLDFRKYCFVDLGCGKGRVLANAARYPFKSVIGVDFAKQLCEASKSNLERVRSTHRCHDVQVHHVDATEYDLPLAPCVVYIYNSFRGPVLTAVLERIQRSVLLFPRHVRIAYVAPTLPDFFLQVPGIQIFKSKQHYILYDLGI
jgi:SAM-dependent methyltransferase